MDYVGVDVAVVKLVFLTVDFCSGGGGGENARKESRKRKTAHKQGVGRYGTNNSTIQQFQDMEHTGIYSITANTVTPCNCVCGNGRCMGKGLHFDEF